MTARHGFMTGLGLGMASWFFLKILPVFIVLPEFVPLYAAYLFAILVFVSLALPIASLFSRKQVLGTTVGGGVFGFAAFYQILTILTAVLTGKSALSIDRPSSKTI
jgi:hypothetical protein